ncbi:hypothetical protein L211DRAFT_880744 [Terfezia boudieri ATCC MYA-4762]|uniref:Uncharacterized protein n=1 Tax=Terfezia boudieri ATCC MYA-4762 TaxID=1051890 RepID=A0A3N4LLE8_9PEZI|nr:hypothetical protein L211DRAFT_880744 [Terfezia boudieri ATCC MYA-4762]
MQKPSTRTYPETEFSSQSGVVITPESELSSTMPHSYMGNDDRNIPPRTTSPPDDNDEGEQYTRMYPVPRRSQLRTPDRTPIRSLITPPDSLERRALPTSPLHISPLLPHTISNLTPSLLCALSRSLTYSPDFPFRNRDHGISIPATPESFQIWTARYKHVLYSNELHSLWEYSPDAQSFIIKCMPTPIHENVANYAMVAVLDALRTHTGMSMYDTGIRVYPNTEVETAENGSGARGRRIPDLCIKVHLHPLEAERVFTGVVWEVGFSQTLESLRRRARMWFSNKGIGEGVTVHLVVLVHVFEEEAPKEYLDEDGQVIMSRNKARREKWAWPSRYFGGRGLVEEVTGRDGGRGLVEEITGRGGMKKTVKEALKREITEMLLEEDEEGGLMPLLLEPLGANLIVYRRREDVDHAAGMTPEDNQSTEVVANVEQDENASEEDDSATEHRETEQDSESDSESDQDSDSSQNSHNHPAETEPLDAPSEGSDCGCNEASSNDGGDDAVDASLGVQQIYSLPLVHNNAPLASLSSHPFSIRIAELYGPLSSDSAITPHLLNQMPPLIRPHADNQIDFPLEKLAEAVLGDRREMRKRRARDRAEGIVDRAWAEVAAVEDRLRKDKEKLRRVADRESRQVGRRVRKIGEIGGEERPAGEEGEGSKGGGIRGIRQKRVRMGNSEEC